jgi:biotin carboxyl carrier protein
MAAKFNMTFGSGGAALEHEFEIEPAPEPADTGEVQCRLGPGSAFRASWARVAPGLYSILLGAGSYEVRVTPSPGAASGGDYSVRVGSELFRVELHDPRAWRRRRGRSDPEGPEDVSAPMPGKIIKLLVAEGDEVGEDQGLLVMEAMKMQNELRSPRAGRVERIYAVEGTGVETGAPLVRLASL